MALPVTLSLDVTAAVSARVPELAALSVMDAGMNPNVIVLLVVLIGIPFAVWLGVRMLRDR